MKKDVREGRTELVFILDRSGSMGGLEKDTLGGFNAMLAEQKDLEGACRVTTVLFNSESALLHDRIDIGAIEPMTEAQYRVGGSTALLDAIGSTISKIGEVQRQTAGSYRADKVLFVIITDGEENDSRHYGATEVKQMIGRQKERYGWEFIFLGANIDAVETAGRFGISADRAADYKADGQGTRLSYSVMSAAVKSYRQCRELSPDFLAPIREDVEKRGK